MIQISTRLLSKHKAFVEHKVVCKSAQHYYAKWLRYYFDFGHKYNFQKDGQESLSAFVKKLK